MNKVDAACRPAAASLKFTIDNILNLKTSGRSCDSCHPAGLHHGPATATATTRRAEEPQEPDSRLHHRGRTPSDQTVESVPLLALQLSIHSVATAEWMVKKNFDGVMKALESAQLNNNQTCFIVMEGSEGVCTYNF